VAIAANVRIPVLNSEEVFRPVDGASVATRVVAPEKFPFPEVGFGDFRAGPRFRSMSGVCEGRAMITSLEKSSPAPLSAPLPRADLRVRLCGMQSIVKCNECDVLELVPESRDGKEPVRGR
jgi:hypothetical protein